jgi:hypothetical protein
MKQIDGDIFLGEWNGMVHCANLYHTMGGGIARIIHRDYPEAYEADCATKRSDPSKLGHFSRANIERDGNYFDIFNLYGQMGMGSDGKPMNRNARYDAIHDGVWRICEFLLALYPNEKYTLAFPYKMASDLAGGDWNIVSAILQSIESHFPNIEFHIYKLK